MSRLLDIVITHYQEPWEVCRPMLDMLSNQKMVNFNEFKVWLVHDGPVLDFAPSGYFKQSPLQIETLVIPHKGVSAARNIGMDYADSEWICFCDCDDCYSSVFSLMMIFHILKSEDSKKFDLVWNSFYMTPTDPNCKTLVKNEGFNPVFIHNKYYRLSFLREHNLTFPEHIHMSEDSAFNYVVKMEIDPKRIGAINSTEPLYVWNRRPGSITMDFSKWLYNTEGHFERNLYVIEECEKRGYANINLLVVRTMTDAYSMLSRPGVQGDQKPLLKRLNDFYWEHWKDYWITPQSKVKEALAASDKDIGHSKKVLESRISLGEWIQKNFYHEDEQGYFVGNGDPTKAMVIAESTSP